MVDKFCDLYKEEGVVQCPILEKLIQPLVSSFENNFVAAVLLEFKILDVTKKMNPIKALGSNGMLAIFY